MSRTFHIVLIRPSRYDEAGYVVQWRRSVYPFLGLSVLNALAEDCAQRKVLGPEVEITVEAWDDQCGLPRIEKMADRIRRASEGGLVGIVGAQSPQFPRGADLARRFRVLGVPVIMGGFHVSGTYIMLPELAPELQELLDIGVSLFVGEAEGRLEAVLQDAFKGGLAPVYDFSGQPVDLEAAVLPEHVPANVQKRLALSLDPVNPIEGGRGCPHNCSFCTVINVHGRRPRARRPEDVVAFVRRSVAGGRPRFIFTDDNLARNRHWREILTGLAGLREKEGLAFSFMFQTDTLSDRDPEFIPLAARAGCVQVFVGMESINPEALASVGKKHNAVETYQKCFLQWKSHGIVVMTGYIVGFPGDTPQSVRRDIETIKHQLPIDLLYPFILTPLPGSADHARLWQQGNVLDPDLARYTTCLATAPHTTMDPETLEGLFRDVWQWYYDDAHTRRIIRRHLVLGGNLSDLHPFLLVARGTFPVEKLHPFEVGILRIKQRRERRPGRRVEHPVPFYLGRIREFTKTLFGWWRQWHCLNRLARQAMQEGQAADDPALENRAFPSLLPRGMEDRHSLES